MSKSFWSGGEKRTTFFSRREAEKREKARTDRLAAWLRKEVAWAMFISFYNQEPPKGKMTTEELWQESKNKDFWRAKAREAMKIMEMIPCRTKKKTVR